MDKTFSIAQLIIVAVIFLCVITGVVGHIVLGYITSIFGFIVSIVFIYLSWVLLRLSYKELCENR